MKKAQISLFIIIGIVLVVATGLFLYVQNNSQSQDVSLAVSQVVEELPSDFLPLQPFVETCLEETTKDAVIRLGERGGYVFTENLATTNDPTSGQGITFTRDADLVIPYWFYLQAQNECVGNCPFTSAKLPLEGENSVQSQITRYVEENLPNCLDDFSPIKELGFDVEVKKDPKVTTTIAQKDLVVFLEYPIEITRQEAEGNFDTFSTRLDVDLRKMYQFAEYLTDLEKDFRFLERATLNLLVAFSGRDSDRLPPLADTTFEISSQHRWVKSQVRRNVQSILATYISLLRVENTPNWQTIDTNSLYGDQLYNLGMAIPNQGPIDDVEVRMSYLDFWDPYFDLNCDDEICEPENAFIDILPVGVQRYDFAYDVSYPVLVELYDKEAFNDRGYTFQFMLEANVRNNKPMQASFRPLEPLQDVRASLFCDENKRTSGDIEFTFVDSLSNDPVSSVDMFYNCIESCFLGSANERLTTNLPVCVGGSMTFKAEGYESLTIPYETKVGSGDRLNLEMNPLKEVTVEIRKRMLKKVGEEWVQTGEEKVLEEFETATIRFEKENTVPQFLEVTRDELDVASLTLGEYRITVDVEAERRLVIPEREIEIEDEEFNQPRFELESFPSGKLDITYEITKDDLGKDKLTLYVVSPDILDIRPAIRQPEDLEILGKLGRKRYQEKLIPTFT